VPPDDQAEGRKRGRGEPAAERAAAERAAADPARQ
jgi:hypothetical protein